MGQWLLERNPDVLLLQETRAPAEIVTGFFPAEDGWQVAVHPSEIKGRSGVAIVSKLPILESRAGLAAYQAADGNSGEVSLRQAQSGATDSTTETGHGNPEVVSTGSTTDTGATTGEVEPAVDTGRWLEADLQTPKGGQLTVISAYFHSATNTPEMAHTMTAKYAHLDKIGKRLQELAQSQYPVLVGGDFNIAHENRDIANWKGNQNSAGFLPQERAYLTKWFHTDGWTDLGRHHAGEVEGPYTWWSWRGQAFTNDKGWRIDYHMGNVLAAHACQHVTVDRHPTYEQRWTDHAPVVGEYEFPNTPEV